MTELVRLQRANVGTHFRAFGLRGVAPELIDPFLGVDHAWMNGPTFPPHPHAGFSAVSYVFLDSEIGIDNRDSIGNHNLIAPGGLHWTTAGRGIVHEEVPAESGKIVHSLQIFVNLPRDRQADQPIALGVAPEDVPVVRRPGAKVRVVAGAFDGVESPLVPPTDVVMLDITLEVGATLTVPVPSGLTAFVMPIHGTFAIEGVRYGGEDLIVPVFPAEAVSRAIVLEAEQYGAKAMLFAGSPLGQPVHWQGPAAMASAEAAASAAAAYRRGEFGAL